MAWAYAFSAAMDVLEDDPRVDTRHTSIMGHSRHGKAALLAAVWDPRIEAVIAHQSGFAGASLSRSGTGERLAPDGEVLSALAVAGGAGLCAQSLHAAL